MSLITFLLTDTCTISGRSSPGVSGSGDISAAESQLASGVKCRITTNTRYAGLIAGGGIKYTATHLGFFEPDIALNKGNTIVSAQWSQDKFLVEFIDEHPGGTSWFKQAYLKQVGR